MRRNAAPRSSRQADRRVALRQGNQAKLTDRCPSRETMCRELNPQRIGKMTFIYIYIYIYIYMLINSSIKFNTRQINRSSVNYFIS